MILGRLSLECKVNILACMIMPIGMTFYVLLDEIKEYILGQKDNGATSCMLHHLEVQNQD